MRYRKFIRFSGYFVAVVLVVLLIMRSFGYLSGQELKSMVFAKILTTLNFISGMYLNEKGLKKGQNSFFLLVLGGMGLRIFLLVPLIIFSPDLLKLNANYFIFTFFVFYVFFLGTELVYLAKHETTSFTLNSK